MVMNFRFLFLEKSEPVFFDFKKKKALRAIFLLFTF